MKNLNNKNIVCVGSYFDNEIKLSMTENILEFLFKNKEKMNTDIMLVSKSVVPERLFKYVDYLVYDKKNDLIKSFGRSPATTLYDTKCGYKISSNFENTINTTIPALNIFISGHINSVYLGYKNMHFLEYDMEISEEIVSQFIDNNNLLENKNIDFIIYSDVKDSMVGGFFSLSLKNDKNNFFKKYDPNFLIEEINKRMDNNITSATCEKIVLNYINKTTDKVYVKNYNEIKHFHNKILHKTKLISTLYYDKSKNTYGIFIGNISNEFIKIETFKCYLNEKNILDVKGVNLDVNGWYEYYDVISDLPLSDDFELIFKINGDVFANYKFDSKDSVIKFFEHNKKIYE